MTDNPFSFMDFTLEEAQAEDERLRTKPTVRESRVCICGHPVARHTQVSGIVFCKPTRMECPCKVMRPVLEADDVRPFLRKTEGGGTMHALGRGLAACVSKGKEVRWLIEMICDRCKAEGPVSPVPVTQRGIAMSSATGYDALLCQKCRQEV